MKISPMQKYNIQSALLLLSEFINTLEAEKSCDSCLHFNDGCALALGAMPPKEILSTGCKQWENKFEIPF